MTEAIAAPAVAQAPPRSLWADAWSRLLKNRFAVASLAWLALIGAAAGLAPWIVPFDPERQEPWVGKRAPLEVHPILRDDMSFSRGSSVPAPFPREGGHALAVRYEEARRREVRIAVSARGLVERIELGPDLSSSERHQDFPEVLALGPAERLVLEGSGAVAGVEIAKGKPLPEALRLPAGPEKEIVLVGQWRKGEKTHDLEAELDGGRVAALSVDGKPEERVDLRGEDVASALVDGKPFVHTHLLGTDDSGRDILSRVVFGGRISLMVGIVATLVSLVVGVAYGALSGYAGGRTDEVMMRIVDILYAIPFMFFVIILLVLFERSLILLFAAIGAVEWLTMARIVRGQILSLKEKEFVEAARVAGTSNLGIVFGHLVPNSLGSVIVYTTLTIPEVILTEAFLSFLGLSVQYEGRNLESWGSLTENGMRLAQGGFPWLLIWAATALSLTLFALNFLGDGLRDALDPRLRGKG